MFVCPKCGAEIRYVVGSPSSGFVGQPIGVDVKPDTLISEKGRLLVGYRPHVCQVKEDKNGDDGS